VKVSIITVSYNSAATIQTAVESVLSQKEATIEYIIIDGGSTDGTLDVLSPYKDRIDVLVSEPDKGIYDAMNKGVSRATGDVIAILNSDDVYADAYVVRDMVKVISEGAVDGAYADLVYTDESLAKVQRTWVSGQYKKNSFLYGWMPPHPTFFVKRACYQKFGVFNTVLRSAADYELMLRFIHKEHISLGYVPRVTVKMRQGGQSNASVTNRLKANNEDREAWRLNQLTPYWFTLYLKPLRKVSQFLHRG